MHELSVTQQLLKLAVEHAGAAGATRVTGLSLVIGDLSSFSAEAVSFCWELLARDTICEGARLEFRRMRGELTCLDCGAVHSLQGEPAPCPRCASSRLKVTAGDDLVLDSIEVETSGDGDSQASSAPGGRGGSRA
jgi:hydrogenase nickel incorporation protein HypA/HybF